MDLIDRQSAIEHCKKRLYESALDNVGVMCMANNVFSEIADNRIETWLNELSSAEPRCIANIHFSQEQLDEAFEKVKSDILSVKPKTGKWTIEDVHSATYKYCCSECKAHHRARYDFCPTCGAKMEDE